MYEFFLVLLTLVPLFFLAKILDRLNALLRLMEKIHKDLAPEEKAADRPVADLAPEEKEAERSVADLAPEEKAAKLAAALQQAEQVPLPVSEEPLPLKEEPVPLVPPPLPAQEPVAETPPLVPVFEEKPLPLKEESVVEVPPSPLEEEAQPARSFGLPAAIAEQVKERMRSVKNWLLYGQFESPEESGRSAEKLLAATWLLRAGILVILFTAAFMLKLSIDRGLLGPEGRVILSYVTAAVLLFFGIRLQHGVYYRLGQAILGIALVMFYFSTFALSAMYHLAPAIVAAILMVLTTIAAGFIADRFNTLAVAIIAILGGYGTPIMLSTGAKNFPGLFAYMLLLGIGVLWLAIRRGWLPLNWLSMLFCYTLYHLASAKHFSQEDFPVLMVALILFFILYSTVVFVHNVRHRLPATVLEVCALLGNAALFFSSSCLLIGKMTSERLWYAPLTIGLTVFYIAHAYLFMSRKLRDKGLVLSFLGLAAFFLTLTFPVVFSARWLGAAWAMQALLMLWLGYSLNSRFLRGIAWLLFIICLERFAFHDLGRAFIFGEPARFDVDATTFWRGFVERIVQFMVPIACLAAAARISRRPPPEGALSVPEGSDIKERTLPFALPTVLLTCGFILLFLYLNFEVYRTIGFCYLPFRPAALTALWVLTAVAVLPMFKVAEGQHIWRIFFLVLLMGILLKTFFFDFLSFGPNWRLLYVSGEFLWRDSAMRTLNFGFLVLGILYFRNFLWGHEKKLGQICGFLWPVLLFIYSTWELNTVLANRLPELMGGGISVLWGTFAFCFIYHGLKKDIPWLRYLGLGIFLFVVGKVFLYDLRRLDALYRVVAFLLFGLLLMGAAFIYLKFWKSEPKDQA